MKPHNGHYLLEDNTAANDFPNSAAFATNAPVLIKQATGYEWHQMLGHSANEAIQHLTRSAEGMKVIDSDTPIPKTNECEPCALAKARRIVSRSYGNSETSTIPFYRITYDLMHLDPALNRDQWVSHIACHATDFNIVYTHRNNGEATHLMTEAVNFIETRFNRKVVFIRSDGEKSLGDEFHKLLINKGITFEPSTPDTPAQNGHSERKGGILAMKARALRIEAGLPIYLWHEIIKAAVYLANRTPMAKHK